MKMKSLMVAAVALAAASPMTVHAVEVTAFVSNALNRRSKTFRNAR